MEVSDSLEDGMIYTVVIEKHIVSPTCTLAYIARCAVKN